MIMMRCAAMPSSQPWLYRVCERLDLLYSIGIGMNKVLQRRSEELLRTAVEAYEKTGQPQRLFTGFDYQAGTWQQPRWIVLKCESNAQGTNRRAVVTNRPGARTLPHGAYDEYSERGESENRNKELKCELRADRLSDHRYMANLSGSWPFLSFFRDVGQALTPDT